MERSANRTPASNTPREVSKASISTGAALPSPPFISIEGIPNFRDCGGYPIFIRPDNIVRRGILYRSADPSTVTDRGIAQLQSLNITKVFDLRCDREIAESTKGGWGQLRQWEPALRISAPVFTDSEYANGHRTQRDKNLRQEGHEGFIEYYQDILASATSALNKLQPLKCILSHLATCPTAKLEPVLIHCSLGKDRTGVVCALILSLCGVEDAIVAHEYALTTLGLERKVAAIIVEMRPNGPGISKEEKRYFGSRREAMQGFLEWIRQNGGVEQYLIGLGILTRGQAEQLRQNLTADLAAGEAVMDWREHAEVVAQGTA